MNIVEAVETLKAYCLDHDNCAGCIIRAWDGDCQFEHHPPCDIEIQEESADESHNHADGDSSGYFDDSEVGRMTYEAAMKIEAAKEIFFEIENHLARYSHIHQHAEDAKKTTEEYADGNPCEMTSVWEVFSLHKNGWDDYETMCKLQDNIQEIAKSRLLKEIEGDIAALKKKYIGG